MFSDCLLILFLLKDKVVYWSIYELKNEQLYAKLP